jgi:hypothetical protein
MAYSVLTLIRDILGSNFCRQTRYSDWGFRWFPQSLQTNVG